MFILRGDLFSVLPGLFCSCVFQSFEHCDYLAKGREIANLGVFVRFIDLFGYVCFLSLLMSGGRTADCDYGTSWTFFFFFFFFFLLFFKPFVECHIVKMHTMKVESRYLTEKKNHEI